MSLSFKDTVARSQKFTALLYFEQIYVFNNWQSFSVQN